MKRATLFLLGAMTAMSSVAATPTFNIDVGHPTGTVSPKLYGLMTEEISHSYDGGLYAELIQNRAFLDSLSPSHWSTVRGDGADASISLDPGTHYNDALTTSLKLTVTKAGKDTVAGVANEGYWGIPVMPNTRYHVTIIAKARPAAFSDLGRGSENLNFPMPLTVSIVSDDGKTTYATGKITGLNSDWKKLETSLQTGAATNTTKAHFEITVDQPGTVWFSYVSLFPPTWNDRPNGLRKDLMQMMVNMHPKFLRFPGGNYLEGDTVAERFIWKNTIGPVEERHGHEGPWSYRSTDGLGLLEFLEWCEDMKAEPVLAVYAGYSLKGVHVNPGPDLEPFIKEALEEIEYVTGDAKKTVWGARRAKDGHPKPYKLTYVEIGNEDWFDKSDSYDARYVQFYKAIKAKYPDLKLIATISKNDQPTNIGVHSMKPDMTDEHYYLPMVEFLSKSPTYADAYDRKGPEIFVGEWAAYENPSPKPWEPGSQQLPPTPAMKTAFGDAAFMTAIERNSDLIKMNCYAPMFVNVNPGARQWRPNLIGYNGLSVFGSPSYYAIQMFASNLGDQILPAAPFETSVQGSATRDSKTGDVFVKLVNPEATPEPLAISLHGAKSVAATATAITLTGKPEESNSIDDPRKIVPQTTTVSDVKPDFTYTVPANSIVVLKLNAKAAR